MPRIGERRSRSRSTPQRAYFAVKTPGDFYRIVSPIAQVSALIALIAAWPAGKSVRILAASALVLAILGDAFTFLYFYPRNEIMFGPGSHSIEDLNSAWAGWSTMNWLRSLGCLAAVVAELSVLSFFERFAATRSRG